MLDISGSREIVSGGRDTREVRILFFSRGWAAANAGVSSVDREWKCLPKERQKNNEKRGQR